MTTATVPVIGDVVGSKYRLEGILGCGGMGTVFAARHMLSQRRVALKWLDPVLHASPIERQRFLREAEAMGRIEHPSVVTVLDVGTSDEGSYLVMELLRGESLRVHLDRVGRLTPGEAAELMLPAIAGVQSAHRMGVVHRDLKPGNLFLVRPDGADRSSLRILDFGVAKIDGRSTRSTGAMPRAVEHTGPQLGTPRYMSPEQVVGRSTDERTDVWGLGSILYEMVAGRPPFDIAGEGPLFFAITTAEIRPLHEVAPDVPERFAAVVARALAKNPDCRFASAAELGRALGAAANLRFREPRTPSAQAMAAIRPGDHEALRGTRETPIESLMATRRARPNGVAVEPPIARTSVVRRGSRVLAIGAALLLASLVTGAAIAVAERTSRDDATSAP